MEVPLLYIIDNDLISAFDIKIRIHQSKFPCRVQGFEEAEKALVIFESTFSSSDERPDIILISFDLPDMDGPRFLEQLKNYGVDFEFTDVYVFSAYGISEKQQRMTELKDVRGIFTKPLSRKEIRDIFHAYQTKTNGGQISA